MVDATRLYEPNGFAFYYCSEYHKVYYGFDYAEECCKFSNTFFERKNTKKEFIIKPEN